MSTPDPGINEKRKAVNAAVYGLTECYPDGLNDLRKCDDAIKELFVYFKLPTWPTFEAVFYPGPGLKVQGHHIKLTDEQVSFAYPKALLLNQVLAEIKEVSSPNKAANPASVKFEKDYLKQLDDIKIRLNLESSKRVNGQTVPETKELIDIRDDFRVISAQYKAYKNRKDGAKEYLENTESSKKKIADLLDKTPNPLFGSDPVREGLKTLESQHLALESDINQYVLTGKAPQGSGRRGVLEHFGDRQEEMKAAYEFLSGYQKIKQYVARTQNEASSILGNPKEDALKALGKTLAAYEKNIGAYSVNPALREEVFKGLKQIEQAAIAIKFSNENPPLSAERQSAVNALKPPELPEKKVKKEKKATVTQTALKASATVAKAAVAAAAVPPAAKELAPVVTPSPAKPAAAEKQAVPQVPQQQPQQSQQQPAKQPPPPIPPRRDKPPQQQAAFAGSPAPGPGAGAAPATTIVAAAVAPQPSATAGAQQQQQQQQQLQALQRSAASQSNQMSAQPDPSKPPFLTAQTQQQAQQSAEQARLETEVKRKEVVEKFIATITAAQKTPNSSFAGCHVDYQKDQGNLRLSGIADTVCTVAQNLKEELKKVGSTTEFKIAGKSQVKVEALFNKAIEKGLTITEVKIGDKIYSGADFKAELETKAAPKPADDSDNKRNDAPRT